GLALYQTLGGARSVPGQRHLTRAGALRLAPGLRRDGLVGGVHYYDAIADDARHTMTLARTAAQHGAAGRSSPPAIVLPRAAHRICGVRVRDCETGEETDVEAHAVLNCTGVWTDEIQRLSGGRGRFRIRASKGVHIVVPRDRIISETGLILRTATSVLFVIP